MTGISILRKGFMEIKKKSSITAIPRLQLPLPSFPAPTEIIIVYGSMQEITAPFFRTQRRKTIATSMANTQTSTIRSTLSSDLSSQASLCFIHRVESPPLPLARRMFRSENFFPRTAALTHAWMLPIKTKIITSSIKV